MGGHDRVEGKALWAKLQVNWALQDFFPERYGESRMRDHVSKGAELLKKEGVTSIPGWVE